MNSAEGAGVSRAGRPDRRGLTRAFPHRCLHHPQGKKRILPPAQRRKPKCYLEIFGAREHNLKNIDVRFPLQTFCCVTGVSGSGKSTLVQDVLYQNLVRMKGASSEETPGICDRILGAHDIDEVILVDQSPLARSPRSTPAKFTWEYSIVSGSFSRTSPNQKPPD